MVVWVYYGGMVTAKKVAGAVTKKPSQVVKEKAAPKKAAAVRGTKKPAAAPANAEPAPEIPPGRGRHLTVGGRQIEVKRPSADQILSWEASLAIISKLDEKRLEFDKLRAALDEFYEVCRRIIVHDDDRAWFLEARKEGDISMEDQNVLHLVGNAVELYKDQIELGMDNRTDLSRQQRRAYARKKA